MLFPVCILQKILWKNSVTSSRLPFHFMIILQISLLPTVSLSKLKCMRANRLYFANMRTVWKIPSEISKNILMILKSMIICAAALFGILLTKLCMLKMKTETIIIFTVLISREKNRTS